MDPPVVGAALVQEFLNSEDRFLKWAIGNALSQLALRKAADKGPGGSCFASHPRQLFPGQRVTWSNKNPIATPKCTPLSWKNY
jgi:hypothetical protein